jgi:hypothetical protein
MDGGDIPFFEGFSHPGMGLKIPSKSEELRMRTILRGGLGLALVAVGYVLGISGVLQSPLAEAQQAQPETPGTPEATGLSKEAQEKIKTAHEALVAAKEQLANENRYNPATEPEILNVFGILSGGVDAVADLEGGRGVDPETFAALYADMAAGNLRADIEWDSQGRLTYKNKVIRMYPIAHLKQTFAIRRQLAGIEEEKTATP